MEPAGIVDVVLAQHFGHVGEAPSQFGDPKTESQIDQVVDHGIAACLGPGPPTEGRDGVRDRDVSRHGGDDRRVIGRRHAHVALASMLVHQHIVAADDAYLGVGVQERHLEPQPIGIAAVVEVLAGDVLTLRLLRRRNCTAAASRAARARRPGSGRSRPASSRSSSGATVVRAIIHQDELEVLEGLRQYARNRAVEVRLAVVDGGDHADSRLMPPGSGESSGGGAIRAPGVVPPLAGRAWERPGRGSDGPRPARPRGAT